jgi:A/G-specific adenine glycosylase
VHGRHDLPWQGTRDPYRVWLSEIMLQQTQVKAVLGHYARFVARFPDVGVLAAAPVGDVLAAWSGLGYYSRARNLHRAAQVVVAENGGEFPRTSEALARLPGIGRSTAAAIAAFCFGEPAAILDGNVKRVLARVLAFDRDLADPRAERALWDAATALLPAAADVAAYTQGMMDVGATLCRVRTPHCLLCPASAVCAAAQAGAQERYPLKSRRAARSRKDTVWLELRWIDDVFLVEREATGVWAGLWSLPELGSIDEFESLTAGWPGDRELLAPFVHVLTHRDWHLQPARWTFPPRLSAEALASFVRPWPTGRWLAFDQALALGVPAPLRRRLQEIAAVVA